MTTYGVTPTGFVRPSLQEILEAIERDQRALISEGLDQSPESPLGQINGIKARQLSMAWEALETAYNGFDPDRAEDFLLTALSKLTGTFRDAATKSTVLCTCNLDAGTTLVAGETYARVLGKPLVRFTPRESFTAPTTGNHSVLFEAEVPGPVEAGSGQLSVIGTITPGWNSVTNTNPATLGEVAEQDATLRARREEQLTVAGNQTVAAIKADLRALRHEGEQWIQSVEVFENTSNVPDGEGRPAHSYEVLVYDNEDTGPADADDQIAQVIWNNRPSGIEPWGQGVHSGEALNDKGETVVMPFSRVTLVPIYISATLTTVPAFADQSKVKDEMVAKSRAAFAAPGSDVVALYVRSLAFNVAGVLDVPTFTIGTTASPVGTSNIAIGLRQVPTFSIDRIVIT